MDRNMDVYQPFIDQYGKTIKAFQAARGIGIDGKIGPETRKTIDQLGLNEQSKVRSTYGGYGGTGVNKGTDFNNRAKATFLRGYGIKDPKINTVAKFQRYMGIPADGVFGPQTANAYKQYLVRSGQWKGDWSK